MLKGETEPQYEHMLKIQLIFKFHKFIQYATTFQEALNKSIILINFNTAACQSTSLLAIFLQMSTELNA